MILSVSLESFLNFEGQIVGEISSIADKGKFTVLFGRNGSGKSCLVTAIIWCLFDRPKSNKKLINNRDLSRGATQCSVTVRLCSQQDSLGTIDVTKTYKIKGNAVSYQATYYAGHDSSPLILTNELEIHSILQHAFSVNTESIDSVYCAQSSENLQSLKDPLELLRFVETCIGTIKLKQKYESLKMQLQQESGNIQEISKESVANTASVNAFLPKVKQAFKFVKDSLKLNKTFVSIYTNSIESLSKELDDGAKEKDRLMLSLDTVAAEKNDQENVLVASNKPLSHCTTECENSKKVVDQASKTKKKLERYLQGENDAIAEAIAVIAKLKKKHKYTVGQVSTAQNKLEINSNEIKSLEAELQCNRQLRDEVNVALTHFLDTDITAVKRENSIIRSIKERSETAGLQTLTQTLEIRKALRDEWTAVNSTCTSSIEELDDGLTVPSRGLNTKEIDLRSVTNEIAAFEQHSVNIETGIIALRQQLQTKNNSVFSTNICIKMSKLTAALTVDCQILCNAVLPKSIHLTQAIIASIGYNRLLTTIIVQTRQIALNIAAVAKRLGISGILIEILDEYASNSRVSNTQTMPPRFSPLSNCITFLDKSVMPLFAQKYNSTYIFNGNTQEMLSVLHRMTSSNYNSFVSLDGCRVKPGGEIITSSHSSNVWPLVSNGSNTTTSTATIKEIETDLTHQYKVQSDYILRINDAVIRKDKLINDIIEIKEIIFIKEDARKAILKKVVATSKCEQVQLEIDKLEISLEKTNASISEQSTQEDARMHMLTNHPIYSVVNKLLKQQLLANNSIDKLSLQLKILTADKAYLEKRSTECTNKIETTSTQLITSNQSLVEATKSCLDIEKKLVTATEYFSTQSKKYEDATKEARAIKEERAAVEQSIKKLEFSKQLLQEDFKAIEKSNKIAENNIETAQAKLDKCKQATVELKSSTLMVFHKRVLDSYSSNRKFPKVLASGEDGSSRLIQGVRVDDDDDYGQVDDNDIVFDDEYGDDEVDKELASVSVTVDNDSHKLYEKQLSLRQKMITNSDMTNNWRSVYEAYNNHCHQQVTARKQIKEIQGGIKVLLTTIHDVQSKRFGKISSSLKDISACLTEIYKTLVTESDCYLSYSNVSMILYEEGIEIFSSHSNHNYKEIKHLSGGQQSAVSLSLLFAIHSCFPSSFFIFDEIDASLDVRTVAKLGIMIKDLSLKYSNSNFLVVSHRSEMIEMATRILGLYYAKQRPQIISKVF